MTILPYAKQSISPQDIEEVTKALSATWITRGPQVEAFEKEIANYCDVAHAIAFSSGSAALAAAYFAAQTGPSDRILSTPNTFISTIGPAKQSGAQPLFIDIDRSTGNIDLEQLIFNANQPLSRGRPILAPVHFAGIPLDMEELDRHLTNPDVIVIEDAAHAIGSNYPHEGPKVGSCAWSHMTIFSFHPAKTITTGEGGMVTTSSDDLARRLRLFRNNGIARDPQTPWHYEVQALTNNFNFTEGQAALGRSQLRRLDTFVAKRRKLMQTYRHLLKDVETVTLLTSAFDEHVAFHLCVAQIDFAACRKTRPEVINTLQQKGIHPQVHYIPVYRHPALKLGDIAEYFPQMESYYSQALTLPLFYDMTEEDVHRVVSELLLAIR